MRVNDNTEIQIDRKIPMPETRGRWEKYPWGKMKIGDSFLFPKATTRSAAYQIPKYQNSYGKSGYKFAVRLTDEGYRCWRIA